jgi:hypothetical protein
MREFGTTKYNYSEIKEHEIDGIKHWERPCPKCKSIIKHKCIISARQCHREKRKCWSCGAWNKGLTKNSDIRLKNLGDRHSKWLTNFRKENPPWNKGLTKETNKIVEYIGECRKGIKHSEEVKAKIGEYSKKLWACPDYRNLVIKKLKEIIGDPEHIAQWRLKMEQNGWFTPLELKTEFEKYKCEVWSITRKQKLNDLENYENRGRTDYHLDHKYSITQGFLNEVPPEIVGDIVNLEMLPHVENIKKNTKCSISKEILLEKYYASCKN